MGPRIEMNFGLVLVLLIMVHAILLSEISSSYLQKVDYEEIPNHLSSSIVPQLIDNPTSIENKASLEIINYLNSGIYPSDKYAEKLLVISSSNKSYAQQKIPAIKLGGYYLHIISNNSPKLIREIMVDPNVKKVFLDNKINDPFDSIKKENKIEKQSFVAQDILGTRKVWETYNITGKDVIIGIVDTGVDFGVSDLASSAYLLPSGITASFDPTGVSIGISSLNLTSIIKSGRIFLPLEGKNLTIWRGEYKEKVKSSELGIRLKDLDITNIAKTSKSGIYKIGIMFQPGLQTTIPDQYFIFVLVDSQNENVYDTIYVDFDTSLAISLSREGIIFESGEAYLSLVDWDLSDEVPFGNFNPIIARDLTGDSVNDVSMGGLATTLDQFGLINGGLVKGIDPNGLGISLMYDAVGHGTLSASVAVSRGISPIPIYDDKLTPEVENATTYTLPGSAPKAKIIATKASESLTEFVLGWLWSAGLEPSPQGWIQNLNHRAQITSNSWGNSQIAFEGSLQGYDFYSLFLDYLSAPNLLYDNYPGLIFVVAAGNSGPGYGTILNPGSASMAITIGASTMFQFYNGIGGKNDIAWFSSRGPTPYGAIKPDVLTPGNTGFTLYPVITGFSNGTYAAGTFGGTSEATPRAAGVVALIYEALLKNSIQPNIENIRVILKGTAKNLGFHSIIQGSGLANAYDAVSSIYGGNQIFITSKYSSLLFGERLQASFGALFVDESENPLDHPLINNPLEDISISITPAQLRSGLNLTVKFGNGTLVPQDQYSVDMQQMLLSQIDEFSFKSTSLETTEINLTNSWNLNKFWKSSDMVQISLSLNELSWDQLLDNGLATPDLILFDSGTKNYVYDIISQRTWQQQMYAGNPADDFSGDPMIKFTDPGYINEVPEWQGLTYNGLVQIYNYKKMNGVTVNEKSGYIQVKAESLSEEYQFASIQVQSNLNSDIKYQIPIIIAHEEEVQFAEKSTFVGDDLDIQSNYLLNSTYGSFDWGSSPNTGDFRYYRLQVPVNATFLVIQSIWKQDGLLPDLYLFNNLGELVLTSDVTYVGGGFYDSKSSEKYSQNLFLEAKDTVYTLMIHVAQTPFLPGPFELQVYTRYLTLKSIPKPTVSFSQNINSSVAGDLKIDSSNYIVEQFPELKVSKISAQIYQGSNGTIKGFANDLDLIPGPANKVSMIEKVEYIEFQIGDKVEMELNWQLEADADLYVIGPGQNFSLNNDLLAGQGSTPGTNYEFVKFGIEKSGNYSIFIDYVTGLDVGYDLKYTLKWETRNGPIISKDSNTINLDTTIFPNGNFGLLLIHQTNFNFNFETRFNVTFFNHEPFTAKLLKPESGLISGKTEVQWEASKFVTATVYLVIGITEYMVADRITGNSATFDSALYPNGPAMIKVKLTDGIFLLILEIDIEINNKFPSTLLPQQTSISKSLGVLWNIQGLLFISIIYWVFRRRIRK